MTDIGRSGADAPSGYSAEPEPSSTVSAVPVSIPNAYPYTLADDYQRGSISERKAISSFLVFCAARAGHRLFNTPRWRVLARMKAGWSLTALTVCAEQIERGEHLEDQASWLVETRGGRAVYDGIAQAIEARRAETSGSVEDESAVRQDAPQPSSRSST